MKKKDCHPRTILFATLTLTVIFILSSFSAYYLLSDLVEPSYPNGSMVVNITATGEKYHLSSCSYLHSSSYEISLENARSKGYGRCSRCDPPSLITETEYLRLKDEQPIILHLLMVLLSSGPLSFMFVLVIAKLNDFIGFLNDFPDWFFITLFATVYIAILVQGFRIVIIW